ncbi:MAG: hypothetical protein EBU04_02065 [Verrucomicrobia bacterium]|nr:hypothetical protein [Verrucomicrobiota bacterium]NBS03991.1 hypothetical protein [Verrucomicrobiota bacterium]NBY37340.1 hypothetical protein [Verrucomicrobiota bacterium]
MDNSDQSTFEQDLSAALSRKAAVAVPGFADRVVAVVQVKRRRANLIRWSSWITTAAAACLVTVFLTKEPSEESLIKQTRALLASDESAQFNEILGLADDLSVLAPVIEKSTLVDVLTSPGS